LGIYEATDAQLDLARSSTQIMQVDDSSYLKLVWGKLC